MLDLSTFLGSGHQYILVTDTENTKHEGRLRFHHHLGFSMRDISLADGARIKGSARAIVASGSHLPISHCILASEKNWMLKAIGESLQAAPVMNDVLAALPLPSRIASILFGACHMGVTLNAQTCVTLA